MVEDMVRRLAEEETRLVTTEGGEERYVEVAHEALIRGWSRLRAWIEADREALRVHRRLGQAADEWEEHDWEESFLYQGARLTEAEEWAQAHRADLNELEQAFVHACVEQRDRETREAEERRQSELARSRRWTLGLGAALLLAIAFLAGAVWFGKRAADNATLLGIESTQVGIAQETAVVAGQTAVVEATRAQGAEKSAERERDKAQAESTRAVHARETAVAEAERADAQRAEAERQQAIAEARSLVQYQVRL